MAREQAAVMNDSNQMTVSIELELRNVIHPFTKGIWYRAIEKRNVVKAQCDADGKSTGTFLLTPSHGEGYVSDLPSFMATRRAFRSTRLNEWVIQPAAPRAAACF
jgi:hypothetical protein